MRVRVGATTVGSLATWLVLAPTPLALAWVVEVPSAVVVLVVTAVAAMVEVPALPHATSAVVRTTSLVTVRRRR